MTYSYAVIDLPTPPADATIVRQSDINTMQLCPAIKGYRDKPGYVESLGESLLVGDSVHWFAANTMQGIGPKLLMDTFDEWVIDYLKTSYDWDLERIPNWGEIRQEIFDAFRLWTFQVYQPRLSKYMNYYVETDLYMPLSLEENIWLRGTPDLAAHKERLHDYKTAKSDRQWSQAKADLAIQTSIYLALHNFNFNEQVFDFTFEVYNRKAAEWMPLHTSRKQTELDSALLTALGYGRQIKANAYPATPVVSEFMKRKRGWYCSAKWCGAWNICEHKYMNDSVDESVLKIREWIT